MSRPPQKYRYIFRYVFGFMGFLLLASLAVIVSFYFVQSADREAHDRVTYFHLESSVLAERLRRENQSLLRLLGFDIPDTSEIVPAGNQGARQGPDSRGILQKIATRIDELRELDRQYGGAEFDATLDRIENRFRAVEYVILRHDPADMARRAILSFDLAVEQLYRQHSIAADTTHPDVDAVISQMTPYLFIVATMLLAAGSVSWLTMRLLRKSIVRQAEAEHSLAESVERMHHLEKLESLGRLVGGVSHDFNNLLTAILGQAGLLLDKPTDERTRYGLVQIREAGQQAASLTRQLLNFSRPQSAEILVVDVNELIRNIEVILTRVIGEDIEMRFDYGDDLDPVEVDPGQLQQVIINLAVNARDAMLEGGQLSIATGAVTVAASHDESVEMPAGRHTKISVVDTGVGMDRATRERIFEPYFTTKAMGRGTGLGLSTVYGVVKAAGGYIDVTSQPGSGSRFDVLLPGSTKEVSYSTSERVSGLALGGDETVLVVEDEDKIRAFLQEGLERLGYRVLVAADANEGIGICDGSHGQIDIILADVVLPGKSGTELIAEARKLQPQITTILMSGYTDDALLRTGIEESGSPFLYKPFDIDEVAGLIREHSS